MSLERNGRLYGDGVLLGDHGDNFLSLDNTEQAKQLGWSVACPVVLRLIESRGAEILAKRYGEILSWTGVVGEMLEKSGLQDIKQALANAIRREPDEPWGELRDDDWVPAELEDYMFGPASPEGYGLPRMMTSFLGKHPDSGDVRGAEERTNRAMEMLDLIDEAIDEVDVLRGNEINSGDDLIKLTVIVADLFVKAGGKYGIPAGEIFHQFLGTGKLNEDNCRRRYRNIVNVMYDIRPGLYDKYVNLSPEDIEIHHVAMAGKDFARFV